LCAEVFEDFAKDRNDLDDEKCGNGKSDADNNDRIGHGRFDLLAQARAGFEKTGQPVQNLGEQAARLTCFHHADKETVEHAWMFRN
jgi:hypothetical protein